jgi:hypothetical protein
MRIGESSGWIARIAQSIGVAGWLQSLVLPESEN